MTQNTTRHLDLGCGPVPRNPYSRNELFGVDIAPSRNIGIADIRQANLALQAIPFPNRYFDSVSAFDFLEHIPRVMPSLDGLGTRFPFIELMNEMQQNLVETSKILSTTDSLLGSKELADRLKPIESLMRARVDEVHKAADEVVNSIFIRAVIVVLGIFALLVLLLWWRGKGVKL